MRIISFSLYGEKTLYLQGAIMNARSAEQWYPGWQCRFYVGDSVPESLREQLRDLHAEVIPMGGPETARATLWRFLPVYEEELEYLLVRDCDSRFSLRERDAVSEWLSTGCPIHIMRDHPAHRVPILSGMCGVSALGGGVDLVRHALPQAGDDDAYGVDQYFLAQHVYPAIKKHACIHDAYFCYEPHSRPFPTKRDGCGFVGEVIGEAEQPNVEQRRWVEKADNSSMVRLKLKAGSLKDMMLRKGYWGTVARK